MFEIEYLTDQYGQPKAVVIPIEIWRQLLSDKEISLDNLSEGLEDYCLNKAMDEAKETPLLDREAARKYLED
jgi:hypothetical protein